MGIGSEGHVALQMGRRFIGAELKDSYFGQACKNLQAAKGVQADLFEMARPPLLNPLSTERFEPSTQEADIDSWDDGVGDSDETSAPVGALPGATAIEGEVVDRTKTIVGGLQVAVDADAKEINPLPGRGVDGEQLHEPDAVTKPKKKRGTKTKEAKP